MRQGMGRSFRWVAVFATVLGLGLGLAPNAVAGGPTSVLVTSPETGRTTALAVTDKRYAELERLLGPVGRGVKERPASLDESVGRRQINVVWMRLDLTPGRADRVFPGDDPDTVWIHTASEVPETYRGYWHRAARPNPLLAVFTELGLTGKKSNEKGYTALTPRAWEADPLDGGQGGGAESAVSPSASAAALPSAHGSAGSFAAGPDGWWWAIPGLAVGAALVLARQWRTRRAYGDHRAGGGEAGPGDPETGPRGQLLDL